jgi:hypothetical protein
MCLTRVFLVLVALAATAILPGCQIFPHWMQPSQLWKLNRQPAWDEGSFSVPDPVRRPLSDSVPTTDRSRSESN